MLEHTVYKDEKSLTLEASYMSDAGLQEFLDARIVVCSDVLLCNAERRTVYLATRKHKPAEGLWLIGGQAQRGESARDTAVRKVHTETTVKIDQSRLHFLGTVEAMWSYRSEPEESHGRHDLIRVFALAISHEERDRISGNLDDKEYDASRGLQEYTYDELVAGNVRPCLLDYFKAYFG